MGRAKAAPFSGESPNLHDVLGHAQRACLTETLDRTARMIGKKPVEHVADAIPTLSQSILTQVNRKDRIMAWTWPGTSRLPSASLRDSGTLCQTWFELIGLGFSSQEATDKDQSFLNSR